MIRTVILASGLEPDCSQWFPVVPSGGQLPLAQEGNRGEYENRAQNSASYRWPLAFCCSINGENPESLPSNLVQHCLLGQDSPMVSTAREWQIGGKNSCARKVCKWNFLRMQRRPRLERQAADPASRIPNVRKTSSEQSEKVISKMKIGSRVLSKS